MDVALVIRQRLAELQLEQRDLARAAKVTESYVSQILTGRKAPPAPDRTDIYDRWDRFLKLPAGELARVAVAHLKEERMRRLGELAPLFPELRAMILRKCAPSQREAARAIIERQSFGELERLAAPTPGSPAPLRAAGLPRPPQERAPPDPLIAAREMDPGPVVPLAAPPT